MERIDFKEISKRKGFRDNTLLIADIIEGWKDKWRVTALGPGYGKTTILSMLYYFFERNEDGGEIFSDLEISEWEKYRNYLNQFDVIYLDFTSFHSDNMDSALEEIYRAVLLQYQRKSEEIFSSSGFYGGENVLSVFEGNWDKKLLSHSLAGLITILGGYGRRREIRPILLMDNVYMLEKRAEEFGYGSEMKQFVSDFFDFEPDKVCFIYQQTGDAPLSEKESGWIRAQEYNCYYPPFCPARDIPIWDGGGISLPVKDVDYVAQIKSHAAIPKDLEYKILAFKAGFERDRRLSIEDRCKRKTEKYEKYKKGLKPGIKIPSKNIGIREIRHLDTASEGYRSVLECLREMYDSAGNGHDYRQIYNLMQNIKEDIRTDWSSESKAKLLGLNGRFDVERKVTVYNSDYYWDYVRVHSDRGFLSSIDKIKVYVTLKEPGASRVFIDSIGYLLGNGTDGFYAKVSKCMRDETICYWIGRNDFFILEDYYKNYDKELVRGNKFAAHRGKLAISRDLMDTDSYNALQAKIIWNHFEEINSKDEIDIENMYRKFVYGWNGEFNEESNYSKCFMDSTAQAFVLLMDTLDLLMDGLDIGDDDLLLNDDHDLWRCLGEAKCWSELEPWGSTKSGK